MKKYNLIVPIVMIALSSCGSNSNIYLDLYNNKFHTTGTSILKDHGGFESAKVISFKTKNNQTSSAGIIQVVDLGFKFNNQSEIPYVFKDNKIYYFLEAYEKNILSYSSFKKIYNDNPSNQNKVDNLYITTSKNDPIPIENEILIKDLLYFKFDYTYETRNIKLNYQYIYNGFDKDEDILNSDERFYSYETSFVEDDFIYLIYLQDEKYNVLNNSLKEEYQTNEFNFTFKDNVVDSKYLFIYQNNFSFNKDDFKLYKIDKTSFGNISSTIENYNLVGLFTKSSLKIKENVSNNYNVDKEISFFDRLAVAFEENETKYYPFKEFDYSGIGKVGKYNFLKNLKGDYLISLPKIIENKENYFEPYYFLNNYKNIYETAFINIETYQDNKVLELQRYYPNTNNKIDMLCGDITDKQINPFINYENEFKEALIIDLNDNNSYFDYLKIREIIK